MTATMTTERPIDLDTLTLGGVLDGVLRGRPVTVLGFARSGIALARFLADVGADVTVYDGRPASELASAAPWTRRAANNQVIPGANAKRTDDAESANNPPTSGSRRPMRSEKVPIGTETASSVTPKDANRSPMSVGDAPN